MADPAQAQAIEESPLALQLAVRVEKVDPPQLADVLAAAAVATIALLDDERSAPGGPWHDEVAAWNGARIRKLVRRARGAAWERAQEPRGVTTVARGVEVRAFVPGPLAAAPPQIQKLQIRSSPLVEPDRVDTVAPGVTGIVVVVTPEIEMSWGKRAAQCAHAAQRCWMELDPAGADGWRASDRPVTVLHASADWWPEVSTTWPVTIHDGGYTEIPAGTLTACARFVADN